MNTLMKSISPRHQAKAVLAAALALAAAGSPAAVRVGDSSAEGVAAGNTPELMLFIWDPIKEISYTKDLGITVYGENYAAGDAATNLFVYGQQNAGYQKLFDPLNTDAKFQSFLSVSTDIANQMWAILAVSSDPSGIGAGSRAMYATINHATASGTTDPEYTRLITLDQLQFGTAEGSLESGFANISTLCGTATCSVDYAANESGLAKKGELAYAADSFGPDGNLLGAMASPSVFNKINQSSWFYKLTMRSDDSSEPILVDEFDNDANDAFWGLGVDSAGNYILSYTLAAKITPVATFEGQQNRLRTDFTAHYGAIRFIDVPAGDTLSLGSSISPVPEPATWGLMGLGLAVLAARARRRA
ncbi:PEP-CTERM sorting domain-containing protein [Roseateles sp. LKC17W]|uniref:PEP-CTERM sorting domain-containing protein n=1 Tax=Pelomonas margarita TaxID=3299031 RepID=A0ABW7FLC0_9BURK